MARLHDIDKKDWERLLKDNGFQFERAGKHLIWKHEDGRIIPVPAGSKISSPVVRRMVKENRLEGAPYGWSDLWKNADAKAEAAEKQRKEEEERRQQEKAKREAKEREEKERRQKEAERLRKKAEDARREREQRQIAADADNRKALEKAKDAITTTDEQQSAAPAKAATVAKPTETPKKLTPKIVICMNEKRLENFHEYLCAVVEYYHKNGKILKNFSFLAKQYRVKGITQEIFKNYKMGDLKPGEKPSRKLSDTIRLEMAEQDMKAREQMLAAYQKEQDEKEAAAEQRQEPEREPTLEERIDTFEARFDLLGPMFAQISSQMAESYKKNFGLHAEDLLGNDTWQVRLSPEPYLNEWANNVEFDLTKLVFDNAEPEEVKQLLPKWSDKILHAYLTWLYGGKDGTQIKLNFDERGQADSQNEALTDLLRDQGLLDQMIFVKIESWKGCAHCVAVYKDAPDILMVIGEAGADFYTVADDIWYSSEGSTIINPDACNEFGGWGTRTMVGFCLRQMLSEDNHKTALKEQQNVSKQMHGKLMDDINNYRVIWQMYHDDFNKQQRKNMVDFG
ncbi:MAG: type II toxin-antitoxin system HicA family toxin [Prevotella sp.]|nr:type II toxin-antitoxin system HicA family toxin [Prevotella sp.]